jgi:predicted ester cyclase
MATTPTETARAVVTEYFDALAEQDLDRAVATWKPGSIDVLHGIEDLVAPDGIRNYFSSLFAAVPDWRFEVLDMVAEGDRVAVRWRADGTFDGTGDLLGFAPNGKPIEFEGADVLTVEDGRIVSNFAYTNGLLFAQQIGALPKPDSTQGRAMAAAFNAKTAIAKRLRRG